MKKCVLLAAAAVLFGGIAAGCDEQQKTKLRSAAHAAILNYVEEQGQEQAAAYIDQLVAEGKMGQANADKLKAAIPQGVEKLREVMDENEKEEKK